MNTPRTDAAEMQYRYKEKRGEWEGEEVLNSVEPEFARQLERENAELRDALEQIYHMTIDTDSRATARAILEKTK